MLVERSTLLYLFGETDSGLGLHMKNRAVKTYARLGAPRRELVESWAMCEEKKQRVERRSQVVDFPP